MFIAFYDVDLKKIKRFVSDCFLCQYSTSNGKFKTKVDKK